MGDARGKPQRAIAGSLPEGVELLLCVRSLSAWAQDGKVPAKRVGEKTMVEIDNDLRVVENGHWRLTDLDVAGVKVNGELLTNHRDIDKILTVVTRGLGHKEIGDLHSQIQHRDNHTGVLDGNKGAIRVMQENGPVWGIGRNGLRSVGPYNEQVR